MKKKEELMNVLISKHKEISTLLESLRIDSTQYQLIRNSLRIIEDELIFDLKKILGEGHPNYNKIYHTIHPMIISGGGNPVVRLDRDLVNLINVIGRTGKLLEKDKITLKKLKKKNNNNDNTIIEDKKFIIALNAIFAVAIFGAFLTGLTLMFTAPFESMIWYMISSISGAILWVWLILKPNLQIKKS